MTRATGIGSLPGTDVREAVTIVRDLFADGDLPYLPELPARGPGSDMIGRGAALLVDLHAELTPSGWRLADRPGRDRRRAEAYLRQDLDELAVAYDGWEGRLKVQAVGPWTLAASMELPRGERVLTDAGAVRDLRSSLAEGVLGHLAEVERLLPGVDLDLQLDEPSLPAVLAGRLPTASGYGRVPPIDSQLVRDGLREVVDAVGERGVIVHCCDPAAPLPLLRETGAAVAIDTTRLSPMQWESVAATVESGVALVAGCMATDGSDDWRAAADRLELGWASTGLSMRGLGDITVSPACGLASGSTAEATALQRSVLDVARALTERAGEA